MTFDWCTVFIVDTFDYHTVNSAAMTGQLYKA